MRIKADAKATLKSLQDFKNKMKGKLINMVVDTTEQLVIIAYNSTPQGDAERLEIDGTYKSAYISRKKQFGINDTVGFHAGAWVASPVPNTVFDPFIRELEQTKGEAREDVRNFYEIGEDVYVVGKGPAYQKLEEGSSPRGVSPIGGSYIMKPTVEQIISVFAINVQSYYR